MLSEVEPLFQVKEECIQCKMSFHTSRVRPSFRKGISRDSDFCIHYKDEVNPDYYVVRVCPFCGFAFTENFSKLMNDKQRQVFIEKLSQNWQQRDYGGERTWEEALRTYQLALICAQIKQESDRIIASLLHHIAWLYRYKNDWANEQRFLEHALDAYVKVYEIEEVDLNNARLMYLIGELNRRLKNYHAAVQWFSRVVNDKRIMDAGMIRACREMWAVTRENMLEDEEAEAGDNTDEAEAEA